MSYLNFSDKLFIHTLDTAEKLNLGGWKSLVSGELAHITLNMFGTANLEGAASVKMGIHLSTNFAGQYAFSDEFFIKDVPTALGESLEPFLAFVRFDFNRIPINKNQLYYFSLQTSGYTRDADTRYIGVVKEYPDPIYDFTLSSNILIRPAQRSHFSYQVPA